MSSTDTTPSCQTAYHNQTQTFNSIVVVFVLLALAKLVVSNRLFHSSAKSIHYATGTGLILLAIALQFVLWPTCPENCECEKFWSPFPVAAVIIGIVWIHQGSQQQTREHIPQEETEQFHGMSEMV